VAAAAEPAMVPPVATMTTFGFLAPVWSALGGLRLRIAESH
jgi:hypothetical protein